MIAAVFVFLIISPVSVGGDGSVQHIPAQEGEDVTFTCHVYPPNLTVVSLNCRIVDDDFKTMGNTKYFVHSYGRRRDHPLPQMDLYVNHTELNHKDLERGVVSLKIKSVLMEFTGNYKIYIHKLETSCFYNLTVAKKDPEKEGTRGDPTTPSAPGEGRTPTHSSGLKMEFWIPITAAGLVFALSSLSP